MSMTIASQYLDHSQSYPEYREMIDALLAQQKTTGDNHRPDMLEYTQLNVRRMKRLEKTTRLTEASLDLLRQIDRPLLWLAITEAWCGDAAQILPVLYKMAEQASRVELRTILRDEHPELMDAFLTDGARSIPKLIVIDAETCTILGDWGPRPAEAQTMVMAMKKALQGMEDPEARKARYRESQNELHRWYARDKTQSIQREFNAQLRELLVTA